MQISSTYRPPVEHDAPPKAQEGDGAGGAKKPPSGKGPEDARGEGEAPPKGGDDGRFPNPQLIKSIRGPFGEDFDGPEKADKKKGKEKGAGGKKPSAEGKGGDGKTPSAEGQKASRAERFDEELGRLEEGFDDLDSDDKLSFEKLNEIVAEGGEGAETAQFLIDNPDLFRAIDAVQDDETPDGVISEKDVEIFTKKAGSFSDEDKGDLLAGVPRLSDEDVGAIRTLATAYPEVFDAKGDDVFGETLELGDIAEDAKQPEELRDAARHVLENEGLKGWMDTAGKGGEADGEISLGDLRAVLNAGELKASWDPSKVDDASVDEVEAPDDELFETVAKDNGWTPVLSDGELPSLSVIDPKRQEGKIAYDDGAGHYEEDVITYEFKGETYAVSKQTSPFKYGQLENKIENVGIQQSDDDVSVDLPDSEATDFMNAKTTDDGKTVVEVFNETMKDEWAELDTSDPRREYYDLLQAKTALTGGLTYLPNKTTETVTGDETEFGDLAVMDSASLYGLVDEEGIDQRLAELATTAKVETGIDGFMQEAVDKIENKEELTDKIHETMMSDGYVDTLNESPEGGQTRYQNDLMSLKQLDPEKAAEVQAHATYGDAAKTLDEKIENGDYSDEDLELAVEDHVKTGLRSTWSTMGGGDLPDEILEEALEGKLDNVPEDQRELAKGLKEAHDVMSKSFIDSIKSGTTDGQPDMGDVTDRIEKEMGQGVSGTAALGLNYAMKSGWPSTVGGMLPASAAAYSIAGATPDAKENPTREDRMAEARLMLTTVAVGRPAAGAATSTLGKIVGQPGMAETLGIGKGLEPFQEAFKERFPDAYEKMGNPPTAKGIELEGFSEEVRDGWAGDLDKASPDGSSGGRGPVDLGSRFDDPNPLGAEKGPTSWPDPGEATADFNKSIEPAQTAAVDAADTLSQEIDKLPPDQRTQVIAQVEELAEAGGMKEGPIASKLKFVGASLGLAGSVGDAAGGVLDAVLGGEALDRIRKDGTASELPATTAQASMQMLGGIAGIGSAGTGLAAGLIGGTGVAAGLGAASGALGAGAVVFGVVGMALMGAVSQEQKENANEKTKEFFENLDEYGLAEDDWGQKLNYTQHVEKVYGLDSERRRDAFPADKPVWESQPEQYEDFTQKVEKDGAISKGWFKEWEKDHPDSALSKINDDTDDPSGHRRFGDSTDIDKKPETGTFEDFVEDIDRVEIDSIELLEDGRVAFTKDGVDQVVDPLIGSHADDTDRRDIADYLTRLHDVARPGGELDEALVDRIERIHGRTDDYNEVDDLDAFLNPDDPEGAEDVPEEEDLRALGGEGADSDAGTYGDFKENIDEVDVASIRRDEDDDGVIHFKKNGEWQKLDRNDADGLKDSDKLFGYLIELHDIVRPDGELHEDIAARIDDTFERTDDYDDIDDLKELLDSPPESDAKTVDLGGSFGDFKEDPLRQDSWSLPSGRLP